MNLTRRGLVSLMREGTLPVPLVHGMDMGMTGTFGVSTIGPSRDFNGRNPAANLLVGVTGFSGGITTWELGIELSDNGAVWVFTTFIGLLSISGLYSLQFLRSKRYMRVHLVLAGGGVSWTGSVWVASSYQP